MATIRLSRVIPLLLVVLVILPLVTHYYLSKFVGDVAPSEIHQKSSQLDDLNSLKATDLKIRIDEMTRIKSSVSSELRTLESKRRKLQNDIAALSQRLDELKAEYSHQQLEMERLRVSVEQAQFAQKEALEKNMPHIAAPLRILPESEDVQSVSSPGAQARAQCRMYSCFDYSRCSITSGFPVYFYHPDDYRLSWSQIQRFVKNTVTEALNMNIHITFDPAVACIYVVLVGQINKENYSKSSLEEYLKNLAHWNGDGHNHILLNFARDLNATDIFLNVDTGRAIIAQSHYSRFQFREKFDIVVPPLLGLSRGELWNAMHPHCPARRKFLLSFHGEYRDANKNFQENETEKLFSSHNEVMSRNYLNSISNKELTSQFNRRLKSVQDVSEAVLNNIIVETLKQMQSEATTEQEIFFQFSCKVKEIGGVPFEWTSCGSDADYERILQDSTFSLVISPSDPSLITTTHFQAHIFKSLKAGSIPVILGDFVKLPYDDVIDWKKVAIILPKARITELHFLLRSFRDADIISMRRQGRLVFERYMGTVQQVVNTVLAIVRHRLQIPPTAAQEEPSVSVFNTTFQPLKLDNPVIVDNEPEENLGPMEPPFPSLPYQRNISYVYTQAYEMWNVLMDPFVLYPYLPIDPVLPSEAKFHGSSWGFRPIGQGAGGAGKEFSESLGGNVPREQFTIVMLTYEREAVLVDSLQRLKGLPHLNKVLVVWNSPRPPSADLRWPEIGVPIQVIKSRKNSLNNRFLPYDAIETEAILSLDDDAHLRHDEIVFGFRVWRESRDQIVGFPGRFHAWDLQHGGWLYNSNYSCELSMVLTGAAFIHKYYTYLYTYTMPQAIRDKVDEYMNCEDIAMNFLVSHITRKPPSKVTSRWTFRCPGCPVSLSEEESHFHERHKCINFFVQVYGYMPLLNTQFRADSVLFKTRIPHDKQKCFKFI